MKLENKRILLTGAISVLGQELALLLAAKGARLYLAGQNEQPLLALIRRLPNPGHHNILLADLGDEQDLSALAECFPENARLDVLINYIDAPVFHPFATQNYSTIQRQLMQTAATPILLTNALLDCLNSSAIIMNISPTFSVGYPGYSVYCAGESALRGFSEALYRELSSQGVNVLHLSPRLPRGAPALHTRTQEPLPLTSVDNEQKIAEKAVMMLEKENVRRKQSLREKLVMCLNTLMPSVLDSTLCRQFAKHWRHTKGQE
ncbi:SDR family NAD(P)-dependent oxidoreductase [Dickeya lacustris]|uniref:SDR family NAD(P)-dependent oxidoreductase n=1 Tax=Dickeya lacustris TaxID=2259638 RepID=A0ABY8G2X4_9GAMM|nr:SDR family NAD(P)-dependent oxidoreductase [Dickeya lacustris]WFN54294.1 SDR family NAD(P)-dependent oxidoreductase [Dickeya lacustris]